MGQNTSILLKKSEAQHEELKAMLVSMNNFLIENAKKSKNPSEKREMEELRSMIDCLAQSSISPDLVNEVKTILEAVAESTTNTDDRQNKLRNELQEVHSKLKRTEDICNTIIRSLSKKYALNRELQNQISVIENIRRENATFDQALKTEVTMHQLNIFENNESMQQLSLNSYHAASINSEQPKAQSLLISSKDITYGLNRVVLGEGGFCVVHRAHYKNKSIVAVKKLVVEAMVVHENQLNTLRREARCLRNLLHPNIVKFIGMIWEPNFQAIVLEYHAKGDLFKLITEYDLNSYLKAKLLHDVSKGIHYLHWLPKQIIHNDLKAGNILISNDITAKITDFGIANWISFTTEILYSRSQAPQAATISHQSPERWRNINERSTKSDVYSYGILIWETYTEDKPFKGCTHEVIKSAVCEGQRPDINQLPSNMPAVMRSLMKACWHIEPDNRPEMVSVSQQLAELLSNPMIKKEIDGAIAEIISSQTADQFLRNNNSIPLNGADIQSESLNSFLQQEMALSINNVYDTSMESTKFDGIHHQPSTTGAISLNSERKSHRPFDSSVGYQSSIIEAQEFYHFFLEENQIKDFNKRYVNIVSAINKKLLYSETNLSLIYTYTREGRFYSPCKIISISNGDQLFDAKWTPNGKIVYTTLNTKNVVVMLESGEIINQIRMTDPRCLSVSHDNIIYLADQEAGVFQSADEGVTWTLEFKPDDDWKCLQVIKMTSEYNYNFMTRGMRGDNNHLRIYRKNKINGSLTWQDIRLPEIKGKQMKLTGSDILSNDNKLVFLSDFDNKAVHVLSADGQYVQQLLSLDNKHCPFRLSIEDSYLYVGLNEGAVKVFKLR